VRSTRPSIRALHLFALSGFAIAQPLLQLLARHAELFVARRSQPADIALAIAALVFAPPMLLASLEWFATKVSDRLGAAVHLSFCGLLVVLVVLPLCNDVTPIASVSVLAAAVVGATGATIYARFEIARRFVTVLGVAPLVFVAVFIGQRPIRTLLIGDAAESVASVTPASPAPITFVIFDELPLLSLLDASGSIDAVAYPHFAELAATSTWFRNTTSIESRTLQAVPAILTGRNPSAERRLPIASQHPVTLFSLLADDYVLRVVEPLTRLNDRDTDAPAPFAERFGGLAADVWVLYAHTLVPAGWSQRLPPVDEAWRDFGSSSLDESGPKPGLRGRPTLFRNFVGSIRATARPSLDFIHTVLPHGPWQYFPSGRAFHPFYNFGRFLGHWGDNEYLVSEAQWRHLQQVELVDRLLGELLDRLRAIGEFDRSLIVVTADHGASFWSGDHYRDFESGKHPADILTVPLFIKRPFQHRAAVDDANAETIDILPTVLDIIDAPVPDGIDGCSLFDSHCPIRREKIAFSDDGGPELIRHRFPADLGLDDAGLRQKIARFGSGAERSPSHASPYFDQVGHALAEFDIAAEPAGTVRLESAHRTWQLGANEPLLAARLIGKIRFAKEPPQPVHIAIAVGGSIRAVATATAERDVYRIVTLLPETALAGDGPIELFVIRDRDSLRPLSLR